MSILDTLFNSLSGSDESTAASVDHPCTNCPSNCSIYPGACSVCQPYKEKLVDAIYNVEHEDEILARYEVSGTAGTAEITICPYCGGQTSDPFTCEYCGSKLQNGSGKIVVASANDLPHPILEAQDIIFQRYDAVASYSAESDSYGITDALSSIMSKGLIGSIAGLISGSTDTSSGTASIGNKMTEDEIKEMASNYGVSVAAYLTGLDNGKYLTVTGKNAYVTASQNYSSTGSVAGTVAKGAAAVGLGSLLASSLSSSHKKAAAPNHHAGNRPPQAPHNMEGGMPVRGNIPGGRTGGNNAGRQKGDAQGRRPDGNNAGRPNGDAQGRRPDGSRPSGRPSGGRRG